MKKVKPTLVIGASTNPSRYSNRAINLLRTYGHPVFGLGKDHGIVSDVELVQDWDTEWKIDTVTLYINPRIQSQYYDKIIQLKPKRVIFNPGTENREFTKMLEQNGIEWEEACTLVLLSIGEY